MAFPPHEDGGTHYWPQARHRWLVRCRISQECARTLIFPGTVGGAHIVVIPQGREDRVEVAFSTDRHDMDLDPQHVRGASRLRAKFAPFGSVGLTIAAMTFAVGTASCSNCNRFVFTSPV